MEVELKLLVAPTDVPLLRRFVLPPGWQRGKAKTARLLSIYFDSPDFFLKQRAIALRVRRVGQRWIQTLKSGGDVKAGLHSRLELEAPVAHDHPDFTKIEDAALQELLLSPELDGKLQPAFTTEFQRTIWLLESAAGDVVEMALDRGEIRGTAGTQAISEVELELKTGNPAVLFEIALALLDAAPLHLENASKAQRGYDLCTPPAPPQPVKAKSVDLRNGFSAGQAFQTIAWNCIGHLQNNHAGLLSGNDIEYVHQMRVALRRLRSATGLFARIAPTLRESPLLDEMRWIAGELGEARDWDVFVSETLPPILVASLDSAPLHRLRDQALVIDAAANDKARVAAASQRYQRFLLNLGVWLNHETWRDGLTKKQRAALDRPVREWAPKLLAKRHTQLLARGANLAALTSLERHALRIAGKKLRYAAEFLSHLFPGPATQPYLKALSVLQDSLGVLNDHVVTGSLLDQLRGTAKNGALRECAIGEIMGWNACQASIHLAQLGQVWEGFKSQKPFW
ncbi:MAG: CHAD domain-containing protein [Sulfuricella sp.]|nr:CHAD domain-containing protein [Sulfuricella sp.]